MPLPLQLLRYADRFFPPDSLTYLSAEEQTGHELVKASNTMGAYLQELPSRDIDVLDYGCGWGGETLWVAPQVRSVTGVDIEEEAIRQARRALAHAGGNNCTFESCPGGWLPFPDNTFDAVLSTDVFEHVMDLDQAFGEIARVLKPGGVLLSRFGPLFLSPHGYHLYWACKVPYAHLLFGLEGVLALRNARGRNQRDARRWQELGLNGKRFRDYERAVRGAGFQIERFEPIPVKGLRRLARLPLIGDLFVFGVDCKVRKPLG